MVNLNWRTQPDALKILGMREYACTYIWYKLEWCMTTITCSSKSTCMVLSHLLWQLVYGISIKLPNFKLPHDICSEYGQNFTEPDIIMTACYYLVLLSTHQDHMPAIQIFGDLRTHPEDQNWSLNDSILHDHFLPGFLSLYAWCSWQPCLARFDRPFSTAHHLVFGLSIDWFSPFTTICQKYFSVISHILILYFQNRTCGSIVLYCLNFPPYLHYLPENTFIVAVTPHYMHQIWLPSPTLLNLSLILFSNMALLQVNHFLHFHILLVVAFR